MSEYRLVMAGIMVPVGLAPLTIVWPVIDTIMCVLLLASLGSAVAAYWLREAHRELRFRREMRALDAPRARPPLVAGDRRLCVTRQAVHQRFGTARAATVEEPS